MKDYRNIFPFKIGTSSFVLHVKKDNIIRNIEFLKDSFDKIQLLLFGKDYLDDFFKFRHPDSPSPNHVKLREHLLKEKEKLGRKLPKVIEKFIQSAQPF